MKILAIETSGLFGGVALAEGERLVLEKELSGPRRSAQLLAPTMRDLLGQAGWPPRELDLVAVCHGPGSFTGLRLGVTTAKLMAYAAQADVLGLDTLEVIAAGAPGDAGTLHVALDAGRGQVYAADFETSRENLPARLTPTRIEDAHDWLARLTSVGVATGPALKELASRLPSGVQVVDPENWAPKASVLARAAHQLHQAGRRDDVWRLTPFYLRLSAAEEKARQRPDRGNDEARQ